MTSTLSVLILLSVLAQAPQATITPAPPEPWEIEYGIAFYAGRCLVSKCLVFKGYIVEQPAKDASAVSVQAAEVLLGTPPATNPLVLARENSSRNGFERMAWRRAELNVNEPVIVLVALENGIGVSPGHPFLVTSNEREIRGLETAVSEIKRLRENPDRIVDDVASLLTVRNGALAGYLAAYLTLAEPSLSRKAELLPKILASTSVAPGLLEGLAVTTATCFDYTSSAGQAAMIRQLMEMALNSEQLRAKAGLRALSHLVMNDRSLWTQLPPDTQVQVARAYFELARRGKIQPDRFLEPLFKTVAR